MNMIGKSTNSRMKNKFRYIYYLYQYNIIQMVIKLIIINCIKFMCK